jgi:CBS domain-containing protein
MASVKSVMKRDLATAAPSESVGAAVRRMGERGLGSLLIVEEGRLVGIFSERDLLRRVVLAGKDPEATRLAEVSTPEPVVVAEETSIRDCTHLLRRHGFRHLPVVDEGGRAVGILSARDFLQFVIEGLESFIDRARAEKHLQEMTDPYELVG